MVRTIGEAAKYCVPSAIALLTGFPRAAVVLGLHKKIGAINYSGGYMHQDYIAYIRTLPKSILELGEMRRGPISAANLPTGLWLISGEVAGYTGQGHCFIVWNGLLFDNNNVARPINHNYRCWKYYPVINSRFNETVNNMLKKAAA